MCASVTTILSLCKMEATTVEVAVDIDDPASFSEENSLRIQTMVAQHGVAPLEADGLAVARRSTGAVTAVRARCEVGER